ncbi:MAG: tripartite tricarboxylate transporter substrate-binding protein [Candidatus Binatia bacterium]
MKKIALIKAITLSLLFFFIWGGSIASKVWAQSKPFYKGKTIRIIVGFTPGGFYDRWSRHMARFMGKYIPGKPNFVVQNMPGAGSRIAANYLYGVAKPDGLTFGTINKNLYFDQVIGNEQVRYDWPKYSWIGSPERPPDVFYMRADAPYKNMDDIKNAATPPKCGSTGRANSGYVIPKILEKTMGIKFKVVLGYKGGRQIDLAVERGEVICRVMTITPHLGREPFLTWHKKKFDRHLLQSGRKPFPGAPEIPSIFDLAKKYKVSDENMKFISLVTAANEFGRPYVGPPGIPQDRADILSKAFMSVLKDPKANAVAKKLRMKADPVGVKKLKTMAREVVNSPPAVAERFKKLIGG